ncbi:hypothetical protein HG531_012639 [Fusarium graminearum]|nr:hypothetical protein HG531_012639 [Fusarium graminearum]
MPSSSTSITNFFLSPSLIKESGSVHPLEVVEHVAKRHPKDSVVTKLVLELLDHTKDKLSIFAVRSKHFSPQPFLAKNSISRDYGGYAACEILDSCSRPSAFHRLGQPGLVGVLALGKVQGLGTCLLLLLVLAGLLEGCVVDLAVLSKVSILQIQVIIHDSRDPFSVTVDDETVDTTFFISCNANLPHQVFAMSDGGESSQPPAVASCTLLDVRTGKAIDGELGVFKDPRDAMNRTRPSLSADKAPVSVAVLTIARFLRPPSIARGSVFDVLVIIAIASADRAGISDETKEAVILVRCKIGLNVKVRIAELGICTLALFDDGTNSSTAILSSSLVALRRVSSFGLRRVRVCKEGFVQTLRENRGYLAGSLGVILFPKL